MSHWPATKPDTGVAARIEALFGSAILGITEHCGETTVLIVRDAIVDVVTGLRDDPDLAYDQLMDLSGADYPERVCRFDVNYHLLSLTKNRRIRVKLHTDETLPVPSLTSLYPVAGWFEREVWDCYGVIFDGNPDLRRILTDYGFQGHPFRKDFPLTGYVELRYSRGAQARRLRAGQARAGVPQFRLPVAVGGDRLHASRRREGDRRPTHPRQRPCRRSRRPTRRAPGRARKARPSPMGRGASNPSRCHPRESGDP